MQTITLRETIKETMIGYQSGVRYTLIRDAGNGVTHVIPLSVDEAEKLCTELQAWIPAAKKLASLAEPTPWPVSPEMAKTMGLLK
jgi:hypothetical protein